MERKGRLAALKRRFELIIFAESDFNFYFINLTRRPTSFF